MLISRTERYLFLTRKGFLIFEEKEILMTKKSLASAIAGELHNRDVRKEIPKIKTIFHVSDDSGNQKDFIVKKGVKGVLYNTDDILKILEVAESIILDAIREGKDISIAGFGTLSAIKRKERRTKHPTTGEPVVIPEHYVPNFAAGSKLKVAARLYGDNLAELEENSVEEFYEIEEDLEEDYES